MTNEQTPAPAAPKKSARIESIDGLKGLSAVWVLVFHYLLAFAPFGAIGFGFGLTTNEQKYNVYFDNFPFSVFTNTPFVLYVFFALIAFIPALRFWQKGDGDFLAKQMVTRYFRLMPATLASALLGFLGFWLFRDIHLQYNEVVGNPWMKALFYDNLSFGGAVYAGVYDSPIHGDSTYGSVLWCMQTVLVGSYLTYAVLLMFGKLRNRWLIYLPLLALSFLAPIYTAFLGGIVAADYSVNAAKEKKHELLALFLVLLGFVIGNFPRVMYAGWADKGTFLGIGVFVFLLGFVRSSLMNMLFSCRFMKHLGTISFGIILVHFPVLLYFSTWMYMQLDAAGVAYAWNVVLTTLAALPIVYVMSLIFYYAVEVPGGKLCNLIFKPFDPRAVK